MDFKMTSLICVSFGLLLLVSQATGGKNKGKDEFGEGVENTAGKLYGLGKRAFGLEKDVSPDGMTAEEELSLSKMQKKKFKEFKNEVLDDITSPDMQKDIYLIKIFKRSFYDVGRATDVMEAILKWRRSEKVDSILRKDLSSARDKLKASTEFTDVQGRPLLYLSDGAWGLNKALDKGEEEEWEQAYYQLIEESVHKTIESVENGKENAQFTLINDYDGWTEDHWSCDGCMELIVRRTVNLSNMWPRWIHQMVLVNVPLRFEMAFDVAKNAMHRELKERIVIFGRSRTEWWSELTKLVEGKTLQKLMPKKKTEKKVNNKEENEE